MTTGLELWGGVECTVNRVGGRYFDQLEYNGHARRIQDLERFAELGIRKLRYPVLWERAARGRELDLSWAAERLSRLRALGVEPIVGLVHHGSGPPHTSLLDERFPELLAAYAGQVAERFPWVGWYTPVNEPHTTARFSALYGLWYPHARDDRSFARALLNQCRAVALAMRAIRRVNPDAQLVQTDDLGRVYATALLRYQAEFENERRWLGWDLLCGRVDEQHPLWSYLTWCDLPVGELRWFCENPCPPDVIGINHYLTSERVLDERLERYPPRTWGGNGRHRYADVEAVRVLERPCLGFGGLLEQAWERYRLPIAITEAHLGCSREEQLRWFVEAWSAAREARRAGRDVRAVTAWSLLGSFDWNSLLTRCGGHYEPGAFDLSGPVPRPTALAVLLKELAAGAEPQHPVLASPGWWARPTRLEYEPLQGREVGCDPAAPAVRLARTAARPLLITGATGTLGQAFARLCEVRGLPYRLCSRSELDICGAAAIEAMLEELKPWAVINTAGFVRVDDAESEPERCFRENREGPQALAEACDRRSLPLLTFSSDLVFDGTAAAPYVESAAVAPLNVYGRSKAEGETAVAERHPGALIVRTSAFFGPWDRYNFVTLALGALARGERVRALADVTVSPTYVPDLVDASLDLLIDGEQGVWHLANRGAVTWVELGRHAAERAGLDPAGIEPCTREDLGLPAPRPAYTALTSERGLLLPALGEALERYVERRLKA